MQSYDLKTASYRVVAYQVKTGVKRAHQVRLGSEKRRDLDDQPVLAESSGLRTKAEVRGAPLPIGMGKYTRHAAIS